MNLDDCIAAIEQHADAAIAYVNRPTGGQQAGDGGGGDFARCPISAMKRLKWWCERLREASRDMNIPPCPVCKGEHWPNCETGR